MKLTKTELKKLIIKEFRRKGPTSFGDESLSPEQIEDFAAEINTPIEPEESGFVPEEPERLSPDPSDSKVLDSAANNVPVLPKSERICILAS